MRALEKIVDDEGAHKLAGCTIVFDVFLRVMMRAVARGYVRKEHAEFVKDGLQHGFDLGIDNGAVRGKRHYKNYPTAWEARTAVNKATKARCDSKKTYKILAWSEAVRHSIPWPSWRIFPMGAVPKPMEPGAMRPFSDHTKTGLKEATDMTFFRHTLTAVEDIAEHFKKAYYMRVSDVDSAFLLLPLSPRIWQYFMFLWYDVDDETSDQLWLYIHVFGDFGSAGMPGTFKIFFTDVVMGMARSECILTPNTKDAIYVDDISLMGRCMAALDKEGLALNGFLRSLGIMIKELKDRAAAQVQLALGFWWDSLERTRTLVERKQEQYIEMLKEASTKRALTLKERQVAMGRMQRAVLTMPPGAACFLATTYGLMRGLSLPWHKRRTTSEERLNFKVLCDLLQRNLGRGFFSITHFDEAPKVDTDASKSREYTGGGYASRCGRYRWWPYVRSAARHPIDFLEGDTVVQAVEDLGHLWHRCVVRFRIDNSAFQQSAVKGWSRAERLTLLLRRLFALCIKFECVLVFEWVSTRENIFADALSRKDGHAQFLVHVSEGDFLLPGAILRADPRCGQARQIGDRYSSNSLKDGARGSGNATDRMLAVPFQRASVFSGVPDVQVMGWLEEVLDNRLGGSSHRSINSALGHWDTIRARFGWERVIKTDDSDRGGKLITFVWHMSENTQIVGSSIQNYVWAFRQWLKSQRQLDPVYGVVEWDDFMKGVFVKTFVPAEPRRKVPLWWIRDALKAVDKTNFVQVQAAHLMLVLLFTFARSETPVAQAYTGAGTFDAAKQLTVADVRVHRNAIWVRLKGIKQDLRMQRPSAHGNQDWVVIGDVPDSEFSILDWTQLLFSFYADGGARASTEPFYMARDRKRPYLYRNATADIRALWANVVGRDQAVTRGLHGLRVTGYDSARKGPHGLELAVAHGGWESSAHRRYARFGDENSEEVVGLATVIVDQLVEPADDPMDDTDVQVPTQHAAASNKASTAVTKGARITVYWTEEEQWFEGSVTSQRWQPPQAGEQGAYLTFIRYDDSPRCLHRHDLDDEVWEYLDG